MLTVEVDNAVVAFPLGRIGDAAINHNVGGEPVILFARSANVAAVAFSRDTGDRVLTFDYRKQTGASWTGKPAVYGIPQDERPAVCWLGAG